MADMNQLGKRGIKAETLISIQLSLYYGEKCIRGNQLTTPKKLGPVGSVIWNERLWIAPNIKIKDLPKVCICVLGLYRQRSCECSNCLCGGESYTDIEEGKACIPAPSNPPPVGLPLQETKVLIEVMEVIKRRGSIGEASDSCLYWGLLGLVDSHE